MKKIIITRLKFILIFTTAVIVSIILASFNKEAKLEKAQFKAELPLKSSEPVIVDIAKQKFLKRIFQPGRITVYAGKGSGIFNKSDKDISLGVKLEGFDGNVILNSSAKDFDKKTGLFKKPIEPDKSAAIELNFNIPRKDIDSKRVIRSGVVVFINYKTGEILGKLPVQIINSKNAGGV